MSGKLHNFHTETDAHDVNSIAYVTLWEGSARSRASPAMTVSTQIRLGSALSGQECHLTIKNEIVHTSTAHNASGKGSAGITIAN